ncbi:MAG: 4Fe-4S dicluster domain-containing protein [Candidatus Lokiarchaeota archaeon]|nr:4Fe-4S dicluster domain-containing protein [Candidatus Lokiarchaeota archaeon]
MIENDYYEQVRQKLTLGPIFAPKDERTFKIMKILWDEKEIEILSNFPNAGKSISLRMIAKKVNIEKAELKKILDRLAEKGTISKIGTRYELVPLAPGVFEKYFLARKDTKENMSKAAVIFREIFDEVLPDILRKVDMQLLRPVLPYNAKEKIIQIDKQVNASSKVLPFEEVENLINKFETFAVVPCQCRLLGEYSGNPCELAPAEDGCLFGGVAAQLQIEKGWGRKLNKEEAIEYVKLCEERGLIHNTVDDISPESSLFICNCCSCHCGVLYPSKKFRVYAVAKSNYLPQFDLELCVQCGLCETKCPMSAISEQQSESSDKIFMTVNEQYCVGCGVCATNCPENAIKLKKIRENTPQKHLKFGNKSFLELFL